MAKTTKSKAETAAPETDAAVYQDLLPQEETVYVDSSVGLNLRDGPGRSFNVLETLPDGAALAVLTLPEGAEVPGYALVRYTGGEDWPLVGWVDTDFLRED